MDIAVTIVSAGAANAMILAVVSAASWRKHPAASWLCLLLALLSLAAAAILVQHRLEGLVERGAVTLEHIAAYLAGPVLYLYMRTALAMPLDRKFLSPHFAPAAAYLIVGAPLTLLGMTEPPPFEVTVAYMIAYTAASALAVVRAWREQGFGTQLAWPLAILATMAAIHAGQLVRLTSDAPALQDVVALAGAVSVFGLIALAIAGLAPWAVATARRYERSSANGDALLAHFEAMKAALDEGLFKNPDFRLAELAARAQVPVHQASQALSQGGGVSFRDLVSQYRVAEARRLLAAPHNRGVAVEPLGMMSGFRSRSAFYEAFQRHVGMTPAEYRRRLHAAESCPPQSYRTGKG